MNDQEEQFSVDDRGNVADFYYQDGSGEWEQGATLHREGGPDDNTLVWDCWGPEELDKWARAGEYGDEIREARKES